MDRTVNGGHGLGGGQLRHASYTSSDLIVGLTMQTSKEGNRNRVQSLDDAVVRCWQGLRVGAMVVPVPQPAQQQRLQHRLLRIRQVNHLPALSSQEIPQGPAKVR